MNQTHRCCCCCLFVCSYSTEMTTSSTTTTTTTRKWQKLVAKAETKQNQIETKMFWFFAWHDLITYIYVFSFILNCMLEYDMCVSWFVRISKVFHDWLRVFLISCEQKRRKNKELHSGVVVVVVVNAMWEAG